MRRSWLSELPSSLRFKQVLRGLARPSLPTKSVRRRTTSPLAFFSSLLLLKTVRGKLRSSSRRSFFFPLSLLSFAFPCLPHQYILICVPPLTCLSSFIRVIIVPCVSLAPACVEWTFLRVVYLDLVCPHSPQPPSKKRGYRTRVSAATICCVVGCPIVRKAETCKERKFRKEGGKRGPVGTSSDSPRLSAALSSLPNSILLTA